MSDWSPEEIKHAIDKSIQSTAVKAAGLVIEKHFSDRQGDLTPNTEFTKKRKVRSTNSGLILVDSDTMIKQTTAEKRGDMEAAVTNPHKHMPIHTFGGPITFFGGPTKHLPPRDTIKKTCDAEEAEILKHAEEAFYEAIGDKHYEKKIVIG